MHGWIFSQWRCVWYVLEVSLLLRCCRLASLFLHALILSSHPLTLLSSIPLPATCFLLFRALDASPSFLFLPRVHAVILWPLFSLSIVLFASTYCMSLSSPPLRFRKGLWCLSQLDDSWLFGRPKLHEGKAIRLGLHFLM